MRKISFLILSLVVLPLFAGPSPGEEAFTPSWGNPERKSILEAMREDIQNRFELEVLFVVRWMKVKDGWCFALTEPQSKDGSRRYEPYGALLEEDCGRWTVRDVMPLEEGCKEEESWFVFLTGKYPGLPQEILPASGESEESP